MCLATIRRSFCSIPACHSQQIPHAYIAALLKKNVVPRARALPLTRGCHHWAADGRHCSSTRAAAPPRAEHAARHKPPAASPPAPLPLLDSPAGHIRRSARESRSPSPSIASRSSGPGRIWLPAVCEGCFRLFGLRWKSSAKSGLQAGPCCCGTGTSFGPTKCQDACCQAFASVRGDAHFCHSRKLWT